MSPRTYSPYARRSRWPRLLLGGLAMMLFLGLGTVGTLWMLGVPLNPFADSAGEEDPYMVRIPISSQPISAYTRVERGHLINPATGGLMFQKLPPQAVVGMSIVGVDAEGSHAEGRVEAVKNVDDEVVFVLAGNREVRQSQTFELGGAMMNVNAILGRVVRRDKRPGLGFQEATFFPQGTPEGIAGATPEGMRAMTLDATQLVGVHALNAGDRIDLMASFPSDGKRPVSASLSIPGQPASSSASDNDFAEPVLLAQDAIVLKPVYVRNEATTSSSLTQGKRIQNVPKYEVAIAVQPDDIITVQRALNQSLSITCIAHSMKPADSAALNQPSADSDVVRVPVTVRPILAYDVVTRDAFVSAATRTLKTESIPRQDVARMGIITSLNEALGAIARHDIPSGRYLRRGDLLSGPPGASEGGNEIVQRNASSVFNQPTMPGEQLVSTGHGNQVTQGRTTLVTMQETSSEPAAPSATAVGDRPAITRFVPPGMTAFAIPWNRVYGGEHLQIGDTIDLLASFSLEARDEEEETETRSDGTVVVRKSESMATRTTQRTWGESFGFRAEPWFVATDAVVIAPVGFPAPASALRVLGEQVQRTGSSSGSKTSFDGPPVIIAVDDLDVESVSAALATRDAVFTVAMHPSQQFTESSNSRSRRIVILSEPVQPYQAFNENMWKGNRRKVTTRIVSMDEPLFDDAISVDDASSYFGRIFARPKSRGDFLSEADFLPPGTRPGLASGLRTGHTLFAVSDRDIEGLDSFETEDQVAIVLRAVVEADDAALASAGLNLSRPVSTVVVQNVRIARASVAGQTILEIADDDLNLLQAALARSLTDREGTRDRSHLVAVVQPREGAAVGDAVATSQFESFDPLAGVKTTEVIIGRRRTIEAFAGDRPVAGFGGGR